jgi:hypothetical protein
LAQGLAPLQEAPWQSVSEYCEQLASVARPSAWQLMQLTQTPARTAS